MALKKCDDCRKTFWTDRDAKRCPICAVIEKSRQQVETQQRRAETRGAAAAKAVLQ
jgi:hypothetical protein